MDEIPSSEISTEGVQRLLSVSVFYFWIFTVSSIGFKHCPFLFEFVFCLVIEFGSAILNNP